MALTTGAFLSDSGNPLGTNGDNGDHYRDTANQNLWFKTGGTWTLVGNVNDDTPDGVGTFWLHGSGVPLNANGVDNNYYRNTANQDIWFKQTGIWHLLFGTTGLTSATSGVRSINGIQPDAGGDVTLLVEDLGGTAPDIQAHVDAIDPHGDRAYAGGAIAAHAGADDPHGDRAYAESLLVGSGTSDTFERGEKFGNHIYVGNYVPSSPYQGSTTRGNQPIMSFTDVEALTNRGNIADCLLWEMNSTSAGDNTDVSLYAFASTSGIYPTQRWRTGYRMQFLSSLALAHTLPTTEAFLYRVGLANGVSGSLKSANPFLGVGSGAGNQFTGCAAFFLADNTSPYWQCQSGQKLSTQTTVTTVPYVLGEFMVFHVQVTPTGSVEFRLNGVLVATHSSAGIIPDGGWLSEGVAVRNVSTTTSGKKGFYLDEFQFRLKLASARAGFVFT